MHYYQFNIGDYLSHTKHLSPIEDICYRRLLDFYYLHEQPIPNDISKVTRLLCLNKEYIPDVEQVLNEFFMLSNNGWINERADKEIKQYQSFKTAGAAGAAKRWAKAGDSDVIGGLSGGLSGAYAKQETITIKHKPITNNHKTSLKPIRANALDNGFEEFWQTYPKKVGKDAASKSWLKVKARIDDVLKALAWQKESDQWRRSDGQFIPNPATYLNQGRWQDEQPIDGSPF
jgi:uncharacterized protein YdaU (DUF1376 family)